MRLAYYFLTIAQLLVLSGLMYLLFIRVSRMLRISSGSNEMDYAVFALLAFVFGVLINAFLIRVIGHFTFSVPIPGVDYSKQESVSQTVVSTPTLTYYSRVPYHIMRPQRGSIVSAISEEKAKLGPSWRSDVPLIFHISEQNLINQKGWLQRVVGMPGETVVLCGGNIFINGVKLTENYAQGQACLGQKLTFTLGKDEFLIAEDYRSSAPLTTPGIYHVVHIKQVVSRAFFVLWPRELMGFVKSPAYNIPNPPALKIELSPEWLDRLINM